MKNHQRRNNIVIWKEGDHLHSKNPEIRKQYFAQIHKKARLDSHQTQEYLALELGVDIRTIRNWENGKSCPTFFESLEWFRALHINPFPLYMSVINPYGLHDLSPNDDDQKIDEALKEVIGNLSPKSKRALYFLFMGNHGSSSYSVLQLMLSHLHLPLEERLFNARAVLYKYETGKKLGNTICNDNVHPDLENLRDAIENAERSIYEHGYSYNNIESSKEKEA